MSMGQESTDFEWLDPVLSTTLDNGAAESSLFLKEGYLHLMEELPPKKENGPAATLSYQATNLVGRMSDPAIQVSSYVFIIVAVDMCISNIYSREVGTGGGVCSHRHLVAFISSFIKIAEATMVCNLHVGS